MKRIILQSGLLAVGILVLAIGAHAQTPQQYRAEIPFEFETAGKVNAAGKYTVGPVSMVSDGAIAIRSNESGKARFLGLNTTGGNRNWDKPGTLTFIKANGRYHLAAISTATFSMKMKRTTTAVREVAGSSAGAPREEVITINLN
jgi:hypothetical protein